MGMPFPPHRQFLVDAVLLTCAHGVGHYYRHMTQSGHMAALVATRHCIDSRVKLECEREHQVSGGQSVTFLVMPPFD